MIVSTMAGSVIAREAIRFSLIVSIQLAALACQEVRMLFYFGMNLSFNF
ncbi:MAG: hypothetical protein WBA17_09100 [Saprospiraceae bacterium]